MKIPHEPKTHDLKVGVRLYVVPKTIGFCASTPPKKHTEIVKQFLVQKNVQHFLHTKLRFGVSQKRKAFFRISEGNFLA